MPVSWQRGEGRKEGRGQPGAHGLANYGKEKAPLGEPCGAWLRGNLVTVYRFQLGRTRASTGNTRRIRLGIQGHARGASRFNPFNQTGELPKGILASKFRAQENRCTVPIGNDRSPIAPGSPKVQCNRSFDCRVFGFEGMFGFHRFKREREQGFRRARNPSRIPVSMDYSTGGWIDPASLRKRNARATGAQLPGGPRHRITHGGRVLSGFRVRRKLLCGNHGRWCRVGIWSGWLAWYLTGQRLPARCRQFPDGTGRGIRSARFRRIQSLR